jgi:hypothetical protein
VNVPAGDHVLRVEQCGRAREVRVVLRVDAQGRGQIVVDLAQDGRLVAYLPLLPSTAAGVASGIDDALECIDRSGRATRLPKRLAG